MRASNRIKKSIALYVLPLSEMIELDKKAAEWAWPSCRPLDWSLGSTAFGGANLVGVATKARDNFKTTKL